MKKILKVFGVMLLTSLAYDCLKAIAKTAKKSSSDHSCSNNCQDRSTESTKLIAEMVDTLDAVSELSNKINRIASDISLNIDCARIRCSDIAETLLEGGE